MERLRRLIGRRPWVAAALGLATVVAMTGSLGTRYPAHPAGAYGPVWKGRRPPGLPGSARRCGDKGSAAAFIVRAAARTGLGDTFVDWCLSIAVTESGVMLARPANNFDARPPHQRGGAALITAWGVYQWNAPAGWHATHMADIGIAGVRVPGGRDWRPWQDSLADEVGRPIEMYRQIWRWVLEHGGSERDAARGCRVWHAQSGTGKRYLAAGAARGWPAAWTGVAGDLRARIDRHHRGVV